MPRYILLNNMNPYLAHMTNRELLEQIYLLLLQINVKVSEIDNDAKTFGMNLAADLLYNWIKILILYKMNNRHNDG